MACVQTILQQFDQFLLNGSHMLLCQAEIHFFISPCCTSDAMLFKGCMDILVPVYRTVGRSPVYHAVFAAIQRCIHLLAYSIAGAKIASKKADSHVCNACPSEDLCCMIRHMIILYCFFHTLPPSSDTPYGSPLA